MDRFACYECCVQSPDHVVAFLAGVHGIGPRVLHEDFCGTAAVSRRWCAAAGGAPRYALASDLDETVLAFARERARAEGVHAGDGRDAGVRLVRADSTRIEPSAARAENPDVIFVGNFSIGEVRARSALVAYLRSCKSRLDAGGGGVFVCDVYGGATAYTLGCFTRKHPAPGGRVVHYTWRHEAADPRTAMVENSISFRVEDASGRHGEPGTIVAELPRAFVYRWRLWSLAELRDAMIDAGFASVEVYAECDATPGCRPVPAASMAEDWIVLVAARS